jgi:hypothetical protein
MPKLIVSWWISGFPTVVRAVAAILYPPPVPAENVLGARNAIPNWPRGKSTTTAWSNTRWQDAENICAWPYYLSPDFQMDLFYDKLQHKDQQAMIDHWFANYREGHYKQHTVFVNLR